MVATPLEVEGKASVPDVFSSCPFISRTYFESSSVIVISYGQSGPQPELDI